MGRYLSQLSSNEISVKHVSADIFVILMPKKDFDKKFFEDFEKYLTEFNPNFTYSISIGIALLDYKIIDIRIAQDEAKLANKSLKDVRGVSFAFYNKTFSKSILIRQSIVPLLRKEIKMVNLKHIFNQ